MGNHRRSNFIKANDANEVKVKQLTKSFWNLDSSGHGQKMGNTINLDPSSTPQIPIRKTEIEGGGDRGKKVKLKEGVTQ